MRLAGIILSVFLVFGAGWLVGDWYHDSVQLTVERLANEITRQQAEQFKKISADSSRQLEDKLTELKANEKHTEKIYRTEVIKPVFNNICISDEFIRMFNESSDNAARILSGK